MKDDLNKTCYIKHNDTAQTDFSLLQVSQRKFCHSVSVDLSNLSHCTAGYSLLDAIKCVGCHDVHFELSYLLCTAPRVQHEVWLLCVVALKQEDSVM